MIHTLLSGHPACGQYGLYARKDIKKGKKVVHYSGVRHL